MINQIIKEERILSTHTGSLPRPRDIIQMMWAYGDGIPIDEVEMNKRIKTAIRETIKKQIDAGISIVNDGEVSKPSYATISKID